MQTKFLRLHLILLILFINFASFSASASTPVVNISPKPNWLTFVKNYDRSIPSRDIENGFSYQLIEEQIQVEKKANYFHVIRDIVSDAGIQNGSELSVSFDPSYERLDFHEIIIWRNGKPENRLTRNSFKVVADEKDLDRFIYQGSYSAYCILSDIRKGDKIEYSYTITGQNPIFNNRFFKELYMQTSEPVAHLYRSVQVSLARHINIKIFNKAPAAKISDKGGLKCYEWEDFQVKPAEGYDNEPGWYNNYRYIQISDYNNWGEVVDWALKINPLSLNIKGELANRIAEMKAASKGDKEAYFRKAVTMVQDEVRYMGIELGEYSHKANSPEKVFNQRYGDCKDKSLLLASVLNADGIDAHMVLLNSGVEGGIDQFLPSPNAFDHAVVMAVINNKDVWIDATISGQGGIGKNFYFPNYGKGLVIKPGNNALSNIPTSPAGKIICQEKYTVPDEKGKVTLDVKTTYTLNEADDSREKFASGSLSATQKSYLDYYSKIWPKIQTKDSLTVTDNRDKSELITNEHYIIEDFFKKDTETNKYGASFYANYINYQLRVIPNKVNGPVALNYPNNIDYTTIVVLPIEWDADSSNKEISNDELSFRSKIKTTGDTLLLNYKLTYLKDYVPVDKLDEFRKDVKQISDNELSYSFNYIPDVSKVPARVNYYILIPAVILAIVFILLFVYLYRKKTNSIIFLQGSDFVPIGGWLLFIAFGLAISAAVNLYTLTTKGYFDLNIWDKKQSLTSTLAYRSLITYETLGNTILICFAVFCLVLLLNKRDILPKFITMLYIYAVAFFGGHFAFAWIIYSGKIDNEVAYSFVRAVIVAAIWIPYFRRSIRVKETFIVPHPANNYTYEDPGYPYRSSGQAPNNFK